MNHWKTTLTAGVTAIASLVASYGFQVSPEVQNAIVTVGLFVIATVAADGKKEN